MNLRQRGAAPLLAVGLAAALVGCSDGPSIEAFCERVEAVQAAGPLFPDRTDGEPVADPEALEALRDLDRAAPDAVGTHTSVLLAEAEGLVAESDARVDATGGATDPTTATPPSAVARPERADVEAAQAEVTAFVAAECGIELGA